MIRHALAITGAMLFLAGSASAASLCNCCGARTVQACTKVCAPAKPAAGQCLAAADYAENAVVADGVNPLYDISLREVWLGSPGRAELEWLRQFLEQARLGAEKDRRTALKQFAGGKIDQATAAARAKRYDEALVNYYLGMQSYWDARKKH